ncbi:MAG: adenosylcobinamide-phosphate synthase CbiB [Dongiaceae bacterium]
MPLADPPFVLAPLLLALLLDAAFGDPALLYRVLPHPAALLGRAVAALDRGFNRPAFAEAARRLLGIFAIAVLAGTAFLVGFWLHRLLWTLPYGWGAEALLMSVFLAQRSLSLHVRAVAEALERDGLAGGRAAVRHIVGRDPESLDEAGVSRAALESLAENFSDGVTAPLFWGLLLGLPGMIAYKAINTADSMIGHRTERHRAFGWAAARLDDLANLLPARLAGLAIVGAAGSRAGDAFRAMRRDAAKHRSPNAGWQEAAMAGALGIALAGPRRYDGVVVEDRWMGEGGRIEANASDIRRGLALYRRACALQIAVVALIALAAAAL